MDSQDKILLVLDLDETLIHARKEPIDIPHDFVFSEYHVYKRPHLKWFLELMSLSFDLAIWSSADDLYVQEIVQQIVPGTVSFKFVWGRSKCTTRRNFDLDIYVREKRLKKLKKHGYSLGKILIVDDSPEKTKDNFGNAVYIRPFEGNSNDSTLKNLATYLNTIKNSRNVRTFEKRGWENKFKD